jgi:hypothetical protein
MVNFNAFASVFGPAVAEAGKAYTDALVDLPKYRDEQEELAARHALRPLQAQYAQEKLMQDIALTKAPQIKSLGGGSYAQFDPAKKTWEIKRSPVTEKAAHGYALVQEALRRLASGAGDAIDQTIVDDWRLSKSRYSPSTGTVFNPYGTFEEGGAKQQYQEASGGEKLKMPQRASREKEAGDDPPDNTEELDITGTPDDVHRKLSTAFARSVPQESLRIINQIANLRAQGAIAQETLLAAQKAYQGVYGVTPSPATLRQARIPAVAGGSTASVAGSAGSPLLKDVRMPEERARQERGAKDKETLMERRAQGEPPTTKDQAAMANAIFPGRAYATLTPEEKQAVNQGIDKKKQEEGFHKILKEAGPLLDELRGLNDEEALVDKMLPQITSETVGIGSVMGRMFNSLAQLAPMSSSVRKKLFDPRIPQLDADFGFLTYLHALLLKKSAGGTSGRGITQQDLKAAEELLAQQGLTKYTTSPETLRSKLTEVRTLVQKNKANVLDSIRARGIDPGTLKPLSGYRFSGEGTGDVSRTASDILDAHPDGDEP